jgi:hypothetical protein
MPYTPTKSLTHFDSAIFLKVILEFFASSFYFILFGVTRVWTQSLRLAKQALLPLEVLHQSWLDISWWLATKRISTSKEGISLIYRKDMVLPKHLSMKFQHSEIFTNILYKLKFHNCKNKKSWSEKLRAILNLFFYTAKWQNFIKMGDRYIFIYDIISLSLKNHTQTKIEMWTCCKSSMERNTYKAPGVRRVWIFLILWLWASCFPSLSLLLHLLNGDYISI